MKLELAKALIDQLQYLHKRYYVKRECTGT